MSLTIKTNDKRLQLLRKIKDLNSKRLYIWGDGDYSQVIIDYLQTVGSYRGHIVSIVDDEYFKPTESSVVPFSQFLNMGEEQSPIVFGFYNFKIIQEKKAQFSSRFPYLFDFHLTVVNGTRLQWNPILLKRKEYLYQKTYNLLADEKSKKVMQLYLNAATAGEFHELYTECYESPSYFNSITSNLKIDTLIDCGAYDGDSVHDFIEVFPNYKKIIAFEPDPYNFDKLNCRKINENLRDLTIVRKGVGSSNGNLLFHVKGESNSFFSDKGDSVIQIIKLDDIINDTVGKVLIKMDIEGSELNALQGAADIIRNQIPILAICVYHKEEDLIEIPQFIHGLVGEDVYNYYLGFHGLDLAELVFYAIPKHDLKG